MPIIQPGKEEDMLTQGVEATLHQRGILADVFPKHAADHLPDSSFNLSSPVSEGNLACLPLQLWSLHRQLARAMKL